MDDLAAFLKAFEGLQEIPDEELNDDMLTAMINNIDQNFSSALINQSVSQIITNLEGQGLSKVEAVESIDALKEVLKDMVYGEITYTGNKKVLIDRVFEKIFNVFDKALEKYHSYAIELPMTLDEGATVPTYAHDTDAAADLYALEDTVLKGPSIGNKIRTGVKIQLPEGWLALIIPRSSIGAKTALRLSNSVGLIDSGYRGELGVLYDNIDINDFPIRKGDRIAQLLVMPSYRFQAKVVDSLEDSDRGEGGFGSSGK